MNQLLKSDSLRRLEFLVDCLMSLYDIFLFKWGIIQHVNVEEYQMVMLRIITDIFSNFFFVANSTCSDGKKNKSRSSQI